MDCKYCGKEVKKRRNKFCNRKCYITWKQETNTISSETRKKMNEGVKRAWEETPEKFSSGEKHSKACGAVTKGKYKNIDSIADVSKRTVAKMIKRMNLGCSRCGWHNATCDIHHINGKKFDDADSHNNLCLLCPNCHREFHHGNYDKDELITLVEYLPNNWKDFYYG